MITKLLGLLCGLGAAVSLAAADREQEMTVSNLQAAFQGESNAHARYLAFADKADQEGYAGAASLFRAAARAEGIHAGNHEVVIKQFGAVAEAKLESPVLGTTEENLQAAIQGETYERDKMYPSFIKQAMDAGSSGAVQSFQFALAAEAEHARLYTDALSNLEDMTSGATYYVCPVCGFTTSDPEMAECPICATPKDHFAHVS